jgi:hypothetical protein
MMRAWDWPLFRQVLQGSIEMVQFYKKLQAGPADIKSGFRTDPIEKTVPAGEVLIVYRIHGETSKLIGQFYFTPQIQGIPRMNWTADMLEVQLNAALWDNDFQYIAKFQVKAGTTYRIGEIAQDAYEGLITSADGKEENPFQQYSFFKHDSLFSQVQIPMDPARDWRHYLTLLEDIRLRPGRFVRGNRTFN